MTSLWDHPDFDDHEVVHFVTDPASGLKAIIAIHSTYRGPAAGGMRFWHYSQPEMALTDALRLSRAMSFKNAMADLPAGGGKAVVLASADRAKPPGLFAALGRAIEGLGGRYVTAEDVGITVADLVAVAQHTRHVSGLPADAGAAGGDPGPHTAYGVFLGVKVAVRRALGKDSLDGIRIAVQGAGSVGGGFARLAAAEGARLTIADLDAARAAGIAAELKAETVDAIDVMQVEADVFSPCALGAILTERTIPQLQAPIVAGGANNQLARPEDGDRLVERGILYAPDYVINAGGIINVVLEHFHQASADEVRSRIEAIPQRLEEIWTESESSGRNPADVADAMARQLIGRG
jgi:leucine dehydrogenase